MNAVACVLLLSPLLPFTACVRSLSMVLRWERGGLFLLFATAAAVIVRFEKNTALSRGWCTPLTRGIAVCEQNASHNTQILACFFDQLD